MVEGHEYKAAECRYAISADLLQRSAQLVCREAARIQIATTSIAETATAMRVIRRRDERRGCCRWAEDTGGALDLESRQRYRASAAAAGNKARTIRTH